jgi:hypothetical protein
VGERPEPSTRINNRRTSSGRKRDRGARTWPRPCRRALDKTAAAPDRGDPAARALIALMSEKSLRLGERGSADPAERSDLRSFGRHPSPSQRHRRYWQ